MPVVPRMESPPDDAEPRIPGLLRQRLAAGNGNLDLDIAAAQFGDHGLHHLARHGIDGGLARRNRQALPASPCPRPGPALKRMPGPPSRTVATTMQPWVTSGSSPASLTIPARAQPSPLLFERQRKARRFALGQRDRHRIGKPAASAMPQMPPSLPPLRMRPSSSRALTRLRASLIASAHCIRLPWHLDQRKGSATG